MTELLLAIFFISLFLLLQSYVIYPITLYFISLTKNYNRAEPPMHQPMVSVIMSVYNEEKVIEATIRRFMESDYDKKKLEFVIGSDCSSDRTNEILKRLAEEYPNIHFYDFRERRGKAGVLNDLVNKANGEILIFSDANTMYEPDAVSKLVEYYGTPETGGVSGKLILTDPVHIHKANQEGRYWEIENWIKEKEGKIGFLIGANGGIYSLRKEFFTPLPSGAPVMDDFYISLKVLEQGKLFLYAKEAKAEEEVAADYKVEYGRKIRNNTLDIATIPFIKKLLKPSAGFTAYALWSHKIIRWFSPVFLILIFITNGLLFHYNDFFTWLFYLQLIFYFFAVIGYILSRMNTKVFPFNLCFYFVLINTGLLVGIIRYLKKQKTTIWQPTPR